MHNGIDIAVPIGTPIKAIADGTVLYANSNGGFYKNWIVLDHGRINSMNVTSEYGHLSSWVVRPGQNVKQGQVIGYSGNTGLSQGPHLHLIIRENITNYANRGSGINPFKYIKP